MKTQSVKVQKVMEKAVMKTAAKPNKSTSKKNSSLDHTSLPSEMRLKSMSEALLSRIQGKEKLDRRFLMIEIDH